MSWQRVVNGNNVEKFPVPQIHIEPLFRSLKEIRFDTVSKVVYAIVMEESEDERWMLFYMTRVIGWELSWVLVLVDNVGILEWMRALPDENDNIVAAYIGCAEGVDLLALVEEIGAHHTIRFLQFEEG